MMGVKLLFGVDPKKIKINGWAQVGYFVNYFGNYLSDKKKLCGY